MRTIKFRAWSKQNKAMFFDHFELSDISQMEFSKTDWNDLELMQFTGLLDKNGKEIYFEDYVEDEVGQIWVVKWNRTAISLLNISTGDIMDMRNNLTIKSNVYENTFNFTPKHTEVSPYSERSDN